MSADSLSDIIPRLASKFPADWWLAFPPNLTALIAIVLVSVICGSIGSLVVSNRMAFFSDALAHCAFAGVTLGMLMSLASFRSGSEAWVVPTFMVAFGMLVGLAIAYVREKTSLASDTVIGVFFAFAVGLGAMLLNTLRRSSYMDPEKFLFGSLYSIEQRDLWILVGLVLVLAIVLLRSYNSIVLGSFNASLARSRGVRVRFWNYMFILLLALIVNLCLKAVGALLINSLLVVPAATAANLGRSIRAMFWWAISVGLAAGIVGVWMSFRVQIPVPHGDPIDLIPSGTIVELCVAAFLASLIVRIRRDRRISQVIANPVTA
ncbi:MAG: metal ABC transporter permease [Gemmataceae bacterium]